MQTATVNLTVAASAGIVEQFASVMADEDREIHSVGYTQDASEGNVEVSFDPGEQLLTNQPSGSAVVDDTASGVLIASHASTRGGGLERGGHADPPFEWDENSVVFIHVENNTASSVSIRVIIYYTEV